MGLEARDDTELLALWRRGSREALGVLAERHTPRLYGVALRLLGDPAAAEDAVQEALLAALRSLAGFRGEALVSTWLHRIVVNKCHDHLRARGRWADDDSAGLDQEVADPDPRRGDPNPEQLLSQEQLAQRIEEAVRDLVPVYREAFVLKHLEGLDYGEMEQILGVRRDTLKMRVYKARTALARRLEGWYER